MSPTADKREALKDAVVAAARKGACRHSTRLEDCELCRAILALDSAPPEEPGFTVEQENRIREIRNTTVDPLYLRVCELEKRLPPEPPAKEAPSDPSGAGMTDEERWKRLRGSVDQFLDLDVKRAFLRELVESARAARVEALEEAEKCVPTNWCDALLTGPDVGVLGNNRDIGKLLRGIQDRIRSKLLSAIEEARK